MSELMTALLGEVHNKEGIFFTLTTNKKFKILSCIYL